MGVESGENIPKVIDIAQFQRSVTGLGPIRTQEIDNLIRGLFIAFPNPSNGQLQVIEKDVADFARRLGATPAEIVQLCETIPRNRIDQFISTLSTRDKKYLRDRLTPNSSKPQNLPLRTRVLRSVRRIVR